MRVLVCGSRDFYDRDFLFSTLDSIHAKTPITEVIEGEAKGADKLSAAWAVTNNIPVRKFPADWTRYGRGAGPVRNRQMLVEGQPNLVVAFSYDIANSRGTKNMMEQSRLHGVEVLFYGR